MQNREHWESVYASKAADEASWYQSVATRSVRLIQAAAPDRGGEIIDVGGGASVLVDGLLDAGYSHVTVLDIAQASLDVARRRVGPAGNTVKWLRADVCDVELKAGLYDVWHDRAVFHFLTDSRDRAAYVRQVRKALAAGGYAIIATFADDGPEKCSRLPVVRYNCASLHAELGTGFELVVQERELHRTPWGSEQSFQYCMFRKIPGGKIVGA